MCDEYMVYWSDADSVQGFAARGILTRPRFASCGKSVYQGVRNP